MIDNPLLTQLFRTEFSKIVSVLCKSFGLVNIQLAEDITSSTFLKAAETWGLKGIPDNPTAWLYTVAKNKTKDHFRRDKTFNQKVVPILSSHSDIITGLDLDLSDRNIEDSQLRMLFAVCNPIVSEKAQITLALRVLCGFGIEEIANALLTNKATINQRLSRTKKMFRKNKIDLALPDENELLGRLDSVLSVLYLLFNEGYYSSSSNKSIRKELCLESMRLLYMLLEYGPTNQPHSNALMALFCFHSSRFEARMNQYGESVLYDEQDQRKWDSELIDKGEVYLRRSSTGERVTKYHLESLIAYWHTRYNINTIEKWDNILQLYNQLIQIEYSPVIALNRTYALAMAHGREKAIHEALKINLTQNHLYHSLMAELYHDTNLKKSIEHLRFALKIVNSENDKRIIEQKLLKYAGSTKQA